MGGLRPESLPFLNPAWTVLEMYRTKKKLSNGSAQLSQWRRVGEGGAYSW